MIPPQFVTIVPRHMRILDDLAEQLKADMYGGIGWKGLMDENEVFDYQILFEPLYVRGLIEDLTSTELKGAGKHFVRITQLGLVCRALGVMLKDPRPSSIAEFRKFGVIPEEPKTIEATASV